MVSTISSVNSTVSIFLLDNIVPRGEILQKYNVEKTREEKTSINIICLRHCLDAQKNSQDKSKTNV